MRKLIAILIIFGSILTACSSAVTEDPIDSGEELIIPEEKEPVTLTYQNWTASDSEYPHEEDLINYCAEQVGIKIDLQVVPYSSHFDKIFSSTLAGSPPDLFQSIPELLDSLAKQDATYVLDEFLAADGGITITDQYLPSAIQMVTLDGHIYGLPFRYGNSAMYVNSTMFEEADVALPQDGWTWDEFLEIAKKLTNTSEGKYGYVFTGSKEVFGTSWEWFDYLLAQGGTIFADGKYNINSPVAVESLDWWANLINEGVVPPEVATLDEAAAMDLLGRGKAAMWHNGPWYIGTLMKFEDANIVTVPLPKGKDYGSSAGGTYITVSSQTEHPQEAWDFMKCMTSKDILSDWAKEGFFMPTRPDVLEDPFYSEGLFKAFSESASRPNTVVIGAYPDTGTLYPILHASMQEVFLGEKTAQEALDATQAEWERILAE